MEKLTVTILEREATIGELETRVEMLKSASSASSDLQGLMASNESDKVAASRAMAQNLRLKDQLEELQMRLIELVSESKVYMSSCQLINCQSRSILEGNFWLLSNSYPNLLRDAHLC